MNTAVQIETLHKHYGNQEALKGISLSVKKGEIFALLGANGAGKTTTLECLEGIRRYDAGNIVINGSLGVQLQIASLPKQIKAREALELFARWRGAAVPPELPDRLGISPFYNKAYTALSTGQKRRLHLGIALLGNPDIIVLDEPTAGLDVEGRAALHMEIRRLKAEGKTILMASHDMSEVQQLCDRLAILRAGEIAFIGSAEDLIQGQQDAGHRIHVRFSLPLNCAALQHSTYSGEEKNYAVYEAQDIAPALAEIAALAIAQGAEIHDIHTERASLEQRFLDMTQEETA